MLFRKTSLSKMVSLPKDRINIYKCRDFCDLVIYTGTGLSGRVAAAPAGSACINSVSHFCCSPGEQDRLGWPEEGSGLCREAAGQGQPTWRLNFPPT